MEKSCCVCVHSPLTLSQLSALCVVESDAEWRDKNIDSLSAEILKTTEQEMGQKLYNQLCRGKKDDYLVVFATLVKFLLVIYSEDMEKDRTTEAATNFLCGIPTVDIVKKMSRETKDGIFELVLFWWIIPIEELPESLFDALCIDG
uniref:Transmembrane domain containing protein n=1 Tax=Marseillevirus sp. TaxID=2809551 RepID=A0AA96ENR8_9VIRU|nr:transmembrane domain containing protein [Marseillevirus sp.]